jgi:hypothetical protein
MIVPTPSDGHAGAVAEDGAISGAVVNAGKHQVAPVGQFYRRESSASIKGGAFDRSDRVGDHDGCESIVPSEGAVTDVRARGGDHDGCDESMVP